LLISVLCQGVSASVSVGGVRDEEATDKTHFEDLTVKVIRVAGGLGVFDVSDFDLEVEYRVLATYFRTWEDGSGTPVFLLEGPGSAIVEKACKRFAVVEVT